MKMNREIQFQDMIARLYPELINETKNEKSLSRTVTFQVTDDCNLACSYCYETHKGHKSMKLETAKKFIDKLLSGEDGFKEYIDPSFSPAIIIEFIGGEPFMEIELIDQIADYFKKRSIELRHPWATKYCFSICSNGTLYFDDRVQRFIRKNKNHLSFSVTIDGSKKLHDACRRFHDGRPSYDLAVSAAKDWMSRGGYMGSKITIAPGNLDYLYDAIVHMYELGYTEINANCVYEEGWTREHASKFYYTLKRIADFWNEHDLVESHYLSLFAENFFCPKDETDLDTWCGGYISMLALDPDGYIFPCIRYMRTSLGDTQIPMPIGSVDEGIGRCKRHADTICDLGCVTRRTQNTDECFYCPIAAGCSDCAAYNYQVNGTVHSRATFICEMHKARSLANVYFWNTYYKKHNINKAFAMHCPKEWAVPIIGSHEYEMLKSISE